MVVERNILHLDLDTFFVSVERLRQPELVGKPIMVGGSGDRGVVSACSYETRKFGVRSGMPMRLARRLCPDALVLKGDYEAYGKYSRSVTEIITERAPVVEKASIDEFYVDMTGMEKFVGCLKWSKELKSKIVRETGLSVSWGLSNTKTVSKIAANENKPDGALYIPSTDVQPFLWKLDVSKLPGVGEKMAHTLRCMGVTKLGTLAQIPRKLMERTFGKTGLFLWDRANGIDPSPVLPHDKQKSMSKELTFQTDTTDVQMLQATLSRMVEGLAYDLRKDRWCAGKVTVKIRYSDFQTYTRQITIPATSSDHQLTLAAIKIFNALYNRRLLVRLVGVSVSKLVRGTEQLALFDASGEVVKTRLPNLYQKTDLIKLKHGENRIGHANSYHLGI
ncbi:MULTISPECIES: DNA polymerase IV [Larkinella]|uniref:DNA polymerase IV n=1 Tax=Larkinella humicola TaxID=2607654 RepID=A0A5N1JSX8_9BACT|nr:MULTISPECIES: DNA polymerase IV [Larkinella]KAA9356883.1 DNA polymerase IV [Larkinella humicola]